jgi:hypothetical protein
MTNYENHIHIESRYSRASHMLSLRYAFHCNTASNNSIYDRPFQYRITCRCHDRGFCIQLVILGKGQFHTPYTSKPQNGPLTFLTAFQSVCCGMSLKGSAVPLMTARIRASTSDAGVSLPQSLITMTVKEVSDTPYRRMASLIYINLSA